MATTIPRSPPGVIATSTHCPYRLAITGRYLLAGMPAARIPASCNAQEPPDCHADLMPIRCLLVDDNAAFLSSARRLLGQQGVTVVGTASDSAEALRMTTALRPDVVLVDIALGDENGFDLARRLAESSGNTTAVIMISTAAESDYADLVAESPAAGFLGKAELSAEGIRRSLTR